MPRLRDGSYVEDRQLDRLPYFDGRSRLYPISRKLTAAQQKKPKTKVWTIPKTEPVLDQGNEGACVGYGITNELRFNPVPIPGLDGTFARQKIYWPAQEHDAWPGGSYPGATPQYEGTSVHAGIQEAVDLNYYTEYHWGFSEEEMALGIGYLGPAVIGINWYSGMYRPNLKGFITKTGDMVGGHCILVKAVNVTDGYYTVYNSWGPSWGDAGTAKISRKDMAGLLAEDGECCIITGRGTGPTTTQP